MDIADAIFPILVILALGIATAVLSRMARANPIVGYLLLGMIVSAVQPSLLSAGGIVHLLAELGVVFLLFDIGLHFSTAHVRREAGDIFGFGPLQVGASTILIGCCAWALGLKPMPASSSGPHWRCRRPRLWRASSRTAGNRTARSRSPPSRS